MKKLILLLLLCATSVYAVPEISASILKYEPTPAEQGRTIDVWVQLSNAGTKAEKVVLKFEPEYPFSLQELFSNCDCCFFVFSNVLVLVISFNTFPRSKYIKC